VRFPSFTPAILLAVALHAQAGRAMVMKAVPLECNRPNMRLLVIEDDRESPTIWRRRSAKSVMSPISRRWRGRVGAGRIRRIRRAGGRPHAAEARRPVADRRAARKGQPDPVLILSALGQVDDRIKGLRAGGDDYLPKPMLSPNCWRGSKCCRAATAVRPRKPPIASATSSSTVCRIGWRAARMS